MSLRAGDWVRVRSEPEILATLDSRGCLEELPFMPQMAGYCGKSFRVAKRAHKLCDTVHETGARRLPATVLLEGLHCDGRAYGGCEMECPVLWKEAWLQRLDSQAPATDPAEAGRSDGTLLRLAAGGVRRPERQRDGPPVYTCQATELPRATTALSVWSPGQYVQDWVSGNATLFEIATVVFLMIYDTLATAGLGLGTPLRVGYELARRAYDGAPYPARRGLLPRGSRTPTASLRLTPGEIVRVRDHDAILATVTEDRVNRGMVFHPDMARYCAGSFHVRGRVSRILDEKTGLLKELKNPCIVLDGVRCSGHFSRPLLCPRGMFSYWREVWLEREAAVERRPHPAAPRSP